jgi:hypothetical protein
LKLGAKTPVRSAPITKVSPPSRPIASAEIKEWFESCRKPRPNDALCTEIAAQLTKMRWAADPPETFGLKDHDELLKKGMIKYTRRDAESPWVAVVDAETDHLGWDLQGAESAAKTLIDIMPNMLRHWEGRRSPPGNSDGYHAIKALADSLSAAYPYIEWPFGKYDRIDPRKQARPKIWHMPAFGIAHTVIGALKQPGRPSVSIAANSVTVHVVGRALERMGYPHVEASTIARYLDRRAERVARIR